jgi:hypothetical protein
MARKSRSPRADDSRASNSRRAERRAQLQNIDTLTLTIPPDIINEARGRGMVLRWVSETCYNEPVPNSAGIQARLANDWAPVPADLYPQLVAPPLPGKQAEVGGIIRRGGHILCQLPQEFWDDERQIMRQRHAEELQSVNWDDKQPTANPDLHPRFALADQVGIQRTVTKGDPQFQD